jgi:hypothetical protein
MQGGKLAYFKRTTDAPPRWDSCFFLDSVMGVHAAPIVDSSRAVASRHIHYGRTSFPSLQESVSSRFQGANSRGRGTERACQPSFFR